MASDLVTSVRLSEATRGSIRERAGAGAVCVLPVGSLEQHGEHLPVGTDSILVDAVSVRAATLARRDVLVAPVVWTGLSPHHVRLGLTVTIEPELLLELTRSIVRSLRGWFGQVVVVNGHGGNRGWLESLGLAEACPVISYWEVVEPTLLRDLFPVDLGSIGHAGEAETSAMLVVAPTLVHDVGGQGFEPILRANDAFRQPDMGASGVLGDPSAASLDAGERFLEAAATGLARFLDSVPSTSDKETV